MRLDEIPRPGPRAGEVLVKIAAKIVWHGRSIALRMAELMDSARAAPADPAAISALRLSPPPARF